MPADGSELELVRTGGIALARFGAGRDFMPILGYGGKSQRNLDDILDKDLPRICWVVRARTAGFVTIECRTFGSRWVLPEFHIGVDNLLIEAISRRAKRPMRLDEASAWLHNELLMPPARPEGAPRAAVIPGRTEESTFLIKGASWGLRVRKRADGSWFGEANDRMSCQPWWLRSWSEEFPNTENGAADEPQWQT